MTTNNVPISILVRKVVKAGAKKGDGSNENFGKKPTLYSTNWEGVVTGGSARKTPNYQKVNICSNHLLLDTPACTALILVYRSTVPQVQIHSNIVKLHNNIRHKLACIALVNGRITYFW